MPTLPVVAVLLSVLSGPVPALDVPPPTEHIVIDVVTVNGSTCPPGSAAVAVSGDNSGFQVIYPFQDPPPPTVPTDMRKNCQLSLLLHLPPGYTVGIQAVDHLGFARLSAGASAVHRSNFFFSGGPPSSFFTHPLAGPMNGDWRATDSVDPAAVVYAPCGTPRNLNLSNEIRLSAGSSRPPVPDFVTLDTSTYHLLWQRCPVPVGGR